MLWLFQRAATTVVSVVTISLINNNKNFFFEFFALKVRELCTCNSTHQKIQFVTWVKRCVPTMGSSVIVVDKDKTANK
jgi:hypothetical protein